MKRANLRAVLAGVACAAAASTALAQPAGKSAPEVYTIDPYHTQPVFEWRHFDISNVRGRFDKTTGTITLDRPNKRASVDVTIAVDSLSTGVPLLDQRLKSSAFFDLEKYPTITFKAADFRFNGDKLMEVAGALTIHGVTRPVTLKVHSAVCTEKRNPTMPLPACGADMELTLKRSDYGVGYFVPLVSDEIVIRIGVEAIKGANGVEGQFNNMGASRPAN